MNVLVVTKIPSPYQVELFDRISALGQIKLAVIYLRRQDSDRNWKPRSLNHTAHFLEDGELANLESLASGAELVVFSWYRDPIVRKLMTLRSRSRKPWCFWGERPGFQFSGVFGRTYRRFMLRELFADDRVPIWGIGHWAIDGYKAEFGERRPYYHVPYTSNLSRFLAIPERPNTRQAGVILFSGSFIERKGVVELCEAFLKIAKDTPEAHLHLLGSGQLEGTLRKMVGATERVKFLGFRDWDELPQSYAGADILCAPSRHDGWGLIVLEAFAAGLPVIASSTVGAAYEVVKNGHNGWLVPPCDASALESALRRALSLSKSHLGEMRARCRIDARPYDIDAGTSRFLAAARKTVGAW